MPPFDPDEYLTSLDPSQEPPTAEMPVDPAGFEGLELGEPQPAGSPKQNRRRAVIEGILNAVAAGLFSAAGRPDLGAGVAQSVLDRRERKQVRDAQAAERERVRKLEQARFTRQQELSERMAGVEEELGRARVDIQKRGLEQADEQFEQRLKQERGLTIMNLATQARESARTFTRQLELEKVRNKNERQRTLLNAYAKVAPQHAAVFTTFATDPDSLANADAPTIAAYNAVNEMLSLGPQLDLQAQQLQMTAIGIRALADVMQTSKGDPLNPGADPRALVDQTMAMLEQFGLRTDALFNFGQVFSGAAGAVAEGTIPSAEAALSRWRRVDFSKNDPSAFPPDRFRMFTDQVQAIAQLMAHENRKPAEVAAAAEVFPDEYHDLFQAAYRQAKQAEGSQRFSTVEQNRRALADLEMRLGVDTSELRPRDLVGRPIPSHGGSL